MSFVLGKRSRSNLEGVSSGVIQVVEFALSICKVDFSVIDGLRTEAEQRQNIKDGVSWTMKSYHLPDENGEANAVDLYPWVNGVTNHSGIYYRYIARAMFKGSQKYGIELEWGGFWSKPDNPHWQKLKDVDTEI